jgi:branched-chain amino acid transport system substrate-binding protein
MMAIKEFNAKGGVLGPQIEALHIDTETTPGNGLARRRADDHPQRGRVPDRRAALGVANAISQVAQKYGCIYFTPTRARRPNRARIATA